MAATMLAACVALACDHSPTSPTAQIATPPLADGNFSLSLTGDSGLCQDIKAPQAGTAAKVNLTATHDDIGTWIAHGATPADGTIEMRLSRTAAVASATSGPAGAFDFYVTGWISGVANDATVAIFPAGPTNRTVAFDGQMKISGIIRPLPKFGDGYSGGAMTFSKDGVSSTCPAGAATWSVSWP